MVWRRVEGKINFFLHFGEEKLTLKVGEIKVVLYFSYGAVLAFFFAIFWFYGQKLENGQNLVKITPNEKNKATFISQTF